MPKAKLPDVTIHYEWTGDENKPVLLFSNSLGTNLKMWEPQVEAFTKHFRVLRYDKRGHGQSEIPPGPYTIEQLAGDVIGLLDTLRLERVYFCGLSIGGMTGIALGAEWAKRFHKVALCNTAAKIGTADGWNGRMHTVETSGMKALAGNVVERWLTEGFRRAHPKETEMVRDMLLGADPQGYIGCCAAVRDADLRDRLASISVPSLVLAGTYDGSIPLADARFVAQNISGAEFVELPAAHLSNVEASADFNRHVLQFLLS
jgi:3-oxoadipate enol-lactonase